MPSCCRGKTLHASSMSNSVLLFETTLENKSLAVLGLWGIVEFENSDYKTPLEFFNLLSCATKCSGKSDRKYPLLYQKIGNILWRTEREVTLRKLFWEESPVKMLYLMLLGEKKKSISLKLLFLFSKKLYLGTANLVRRLLSGVINIYMPLNVSGILFPCYCGGFYLVWRPTL